MEWFAKKFWLPQANQVILIIIFAEFILTTAGALINPLYALFVTQVVGAPVVVIGFSVAIYWIVKSILQLPIARYLDRNHGEVDDYYSMLLGLAVDIVATYLFYFAKSSWHIYGLQLMYGIGDALIVPPFYAIFTRHIDKDREASEWAIRSSFDLGGGSALGGALSGILAAAMGIRPIYLINGTLLLIGLIILVFLRPYIKPRVEKNLAPFYEEKIQV